MELRSSRRLKDETSPSPKRMRVETGKSLSMRPRRIRFQEKTPEEEVEVTRSSGTQEVPAGNEGKKADELVAEEKKTEELVAEEKKAEEVVGEDKKTGKQTAEEEKKPEDQVDEVKDDPQAEDVPVEAMDMAMQILRRRLYDLQNGTLLPCAEDNQKKLRELLKDTIVHACNNSALLLGPRGCGKSMVLEHVLKEMQSNYANSVSIVRLNGLLHADDRCALKEIAKQLCIEYSVEFSKAASFSENLRFLTIIMEKFSLSRKTLIVVLDEFDLFAQKPKQCLLYNLLNLLQSSSTQAAIVGLSCRLDADQLLEKRVRSRFSQRKLLFLPPSPEEFKSYLETVFLVPVNSSGQFSQYAKVFNMKISALLRKESTGELLRDLTTVELSPRYVIDTIFRQVCDMLKKKSSTARKASPTLRALADLSVLELFLLVSMKRLEDKESETYSFSSVFKEYRQLVDAHKNSDSYTKQAATKAFEHLLERELVEYVDGRTHQTMSQIRPIKLLVSPEELQEGLENSPVCPAILLQWCK